MSVASQIERITTARDTIRDKLVSLGLGLSSYDIEACADAVTGIVSRGAVSAQVKEGETYTIPAGYHNGAGTVAGVAGGGNYTLQEKTITPTKSQQSVTSDSGYFGLSSVTVNAIPSKYADISGTTAEAAYVLDGKVFIDADGETTEGTMADKSGTTLVLTTSLSGYSSLIPAGYHNGAGVAQVLADDTVVVTPSKSAQTITAPNYAFMGKVTVNAIPDEYIKTEDATATAEQILNGYTAYVNGSKVTGTVPYANGLTSRAFSALENTTLYIDPAYYIGGISVVLLDDLENALAEI